MPPKKKTSSKKKKTKQETDEGRIAYVKGGRKDVKGGRKDAKGLARALPETAQALKSGEVNSEEVALRFSRLDLRDRVAKGDKVGVFKALFTQLGATVVPETIPADEHETLTDDFSLELYNHWRNQKAGDVNLEVSSGIQKAFNETCEKWETMILGHTGRPLKETCHLYKTTPKAFTTFVDAFLYRFGRYDTSQLTGPEIHETVAQYEAQYVATARELELAAQGIAEGDDLIRSTCWECGSKQESKDISRCSRCKAACYCSRDCQVKSWKDDHKKACNELKTMYQRFMDNHARVSSAIKKGVGRIQPTPSFDFYLVSYMVEGKHRIETEFGFPSSFLENFNGPSMDVFYESLIFIIKGGKHWLFHDTPDASFASGSFKSDGVIQRATEVEFCCCMMIAIVLSCETSNVSAEAIMNLKILTLRNIKSFLGSGCTMTAKRFLQLYSTMSDHMTFVDRGFEEARYESTVECLKIMMKKYHKKK